MIFASKVKRLYPHLHGLLLIAGFLWHHISPRSSWPDNVTLYILLSYALIALFFRRLQAKRLIDKDNLYFISQFFDAAFIAIIVRCTGGIHSEFYLAFLPVVALLAVFLEGWRSFVGALWFGICYMLGVYSGDFDYYFWQASFLRLGSIWAVGLVTYSVAHFMRSSEKRLLNTLDVLNERTWELESSQAQLSNIYETTRVLSGILNIEQLLGEILRVAHFIFGYSKCRIFLSNNTGDCLYLHASLDNENRHLFEKPEPCVRDISDLQDLKDNVSKMKQLSPQLGEESQSAIDTPLISRGKVIGVMRVVTESEDQLSSLERRLLMIFANAAAVAIDNSLLHHKTQELTITDELTELFNYRFFRNKLSDEVRRADRYCQKLSILMLDIDHFKEVNDRYGHQTGNVILRGVSNIIRQCVRDVDMVARYGGEEFVVILPQTDEEDALTIAERIRETVDKNRFSNSQGQRDIRISISVGGATYPDGVYTIEQLLEKVDQALYKAKTDGRNLIRFAEKAKRGTAKISS